MDYFHLTIFIYGIAKKPDEKKSKEDEQTLAELNSVHCHLQAKCQLLQVPVTLNKLNCSCLRHIINILLTELTKILPYRPPAWLIRAINYGLQPLITTLHLVS